MSSQGIETRTRILVATQKLMEEHRGKGVNMSEIATAAGISRQAVYLHFSSRADLLVATTRHMDQVLGIDERLTASRAATTGVERLEAYIECWGSYIPEIYGVAKSLLIMQEIDEAAAKAWSDRMLAMREGCQAAIEALQRDGTLVTAWSIEEATDLFWTMLSVRNWEQLTFQCGWTTAQYINGIQALSKRTFVKDP
ncbi:MAG: TetR/AcrR family transcriptional regulator [Thermosynechococcaceae cyanobacterium]